MTKKQKKMLCRILIATLLMGLSAAVPIWWMSVGFSVIAYFIAGYDILIKAWHGICARQGFDENFLMAVATVGAFCLAEYTEATAVMLFYQVGEWFQSYAVGKSRKNISNLMDIRPDYANLTDENGKLVQVAPESVETGAVITVLPGEKIPLDGIVVSGTSSLNTASLTGESLPCEVAPGDYVASGCINLTGVLQLCTQKEFSQSTVSKILELVEMAGSKKAKSEAFISRFAKYYTPIVCYSALVVAIVPPLVGWLCFADANLGQWLYRALAFLVISCPCALVVSVPLSFFAAIGGGSKCGILFKGATAIEQLASVRQVAFDKTGTLTQGTFQVIGIDSHHTDLLETAALAECFSQHPIAKSIVSAYGKQPDQSRVTEVTEETGFGITCQIDGSLVAVGNEKLMTAHGIVVEVPNSSATVVYVAKDGKYLGYLLIADCKKADAKEGISALKQLGIRQTALLTGDKQAVGEAVGKELGIDQIYAQLLPADKVSILEEWMRGISGKEKTAYAGDGINDAPVLMRADVGIAMGLSGSDAALEAADVVIMDDRLTSISKAIRLSRRCMNIVYENIVFAIGTKLICLILGVFGITNMWMAIFADVGVMVLAVLNAMRNLSPPKK